MTAALTEARPVLSYKDPTGEAAAWHADQSRRSRRRAENALTELGEAIEHLRDSYTHADLKHRPVIAARFAEYNRRASALSVRLAKEPKPRECPTVAPRWVRLDGRAARLGDSPPVRRRHGQAR